MRKRMLLLLMLILTLNTLLGFTKQPTVIQQQKNVEIHFIDTGNSDSILIKDNGKNMLIDGAENDDEKLIVDYLKAQDIKKLDYVVLTHPDADHSGGLDNVIKNFEIGTVLIGNGSAETKTYKDFLQAAIDKKLKPSVPLEKEFTLGEGKFKFYNQKSVAKDVNDRSLVMLYTFSNHKFLFTGDAGVEVEKVLPLKEIGDIDVLKVGHHGSNTSSSKAFIDSVKPEYSIICVGKDNKYGHPTKEVIDKLKNTKIYRTDLNGNIVLTSDGKTVTVKTDKDDKITNNTQVTKPVVTTTGDNKVVYITKTGKKYHLETCGTLKSKIQSTIKDAKSKGLTPCGVCNP